MIYISSACVCDDDMTTTVRQLAEKNFLNIELTGGAQYQEGLLNDLKKLKNKYRLNFRCHNYFPCPQEPFVLNLGSLNQEDFDRSLNFVKNSLRWAEQLGARKHGVHGGFLIPIKVSEIGKKISAHELFDKSQSLRVFTQAIRELKNEAASRGIELYVENNVFSKSNFDSFDGQNPFLFTRFEEFEELKKEVDIRILLDVAHLKVSCQTMGRDFKSEMSLFLNDTDYIHVSDNDGFHDLNQGLHDASIISCLKKCDMTQVDVTIEIYNDLSAVNDCFHLLSEGHHA